MNKPKDTSGPAFPFSNREVHHSELSGPWVSGGTFTGLTKREYFAAMAMQGLLSHSGNEDRTLSTIYQASIYAKLSVQMADALLAALEDGQ